MKSEIVEYLGENKKYVCQEFMGGGIIPVNTITKKLLGFIDSSDPNLKPLDVTFLNNLKYYWIGLTEDYEKLKNTSHYRDEIIYILID